MVKKNFVDFVCLFFKVLSRGSKAYDDTVITVADPTAIFSKNSSNEVASKRSDNAPPARPQRHKTEKQLQAEALFGGGGAVTGGRSKRKGRRKKIIKATGSSARASPRKPAQKKKATAQSVWNCAF